MPRYFFNVFDGYSAPDTDGTDLPDRQSARREAIRLAGHVLRDEADRLAPEGEWKLEVTDQQGAILCKLNLSIT